VHQRQQQCDPTYAQLLDRAEEASAAADRTSDHDLRSHFRALATQWKDIAGVRNRLAELQNFLRASAAT